MNLMASVLRLDRNAIKALKVTDPYSLHRVVYNLFPRLEEGNEATGRILYADKGGDYRGRQVLVLSDRMPEAQIDGQHGEVQTRALPQGFLEHESYAFQIIVNPVRRDSASRRIVPVRGRDTIAQWFVERAPSWGFEVEPGRLQVDRVDVLAFKGKDQRNITIAQAQLRGVFKVLERDRFKNSFANGVGRARAFGCGLLQIVPVAEDPFFSE